jgi:hypothetical protein
VLLLGVFLLFKAVQGYSHPGYDPLNRFVRFQELGVRPEDGIHGGTVLSAVCGITALIAGATLLARFPRLAVGKRWFAVGICAFIVGAGLYISLVPFQLRNEIGDRFWYLGPYLRSWAPTLGILGTTAVAGMSGYLVMSGRLEASDRHQRWLLQGMRPLILCGTIAIGLVILSQLFPRDMGKMKAPGGTTISFTTNELALIKSARLSHGEMTQIINAHPTDWSSVIRNAEPVLATTPSVWPVALAGLGFLYLWWLSTLLFDLAFVWHRYVRHSVTNDRLREWNPYDLPPRLSDEPAKAGDHGLVAG